MTKPERQLYFSFHFIWKSIKLMEPKIVVPKPTPMNHHHKNLEGMNKIINISFK
jgi:hypothetical protein